ncbi:MAG: hypothetical protein RLZZ450_600 [Pseudomonadota bacterium]|jgi:hypothetical protein
MYALRTPTGATLDRTYSPTHFVFFALSLSALASSACGESNPGRTSEPEERDAGRVTQTASKCSGEGTTRACTCSNGGAGRKTCEDGEYSSCQSCVTVNADAGPKPKPTEPQCKAGYYSGAFTGKYKPGAFGFGIGESLLEVDIAGEMSNGRPALAFNLMENATNAGGEFYTFTVGDGCMTGVAKAVGTTNPFVARINGDLDCNTGNFVGTLEGKYTLLDLQGLEFKFKGPLTAKFNVDTSSLEDGAWTVDEPPALTGDRAGGGEGTWGAMFTSDMSPDAGEDPCASLGPSTITDAGTAKADAGSKDAGAR